VARRQLRMTVHSQCRRIVAGVGTHGGAERIAHSPEYEAIRKVGESFAKYNIVAVEGVHQ
jgi:predicted Rossmann-fold nucleotide-binding protein